MFQTTLEQFKRSYKYCSILIAIYLIKGGNCNFCNAHVTNTGPVKVNQRMAVFGFVIMGLKPRNFIELEPKFQSFKVWVSALLSNLQLLTGKDRPNFNWVVNAQQCFADI